MIETTREVPSKESSWMGQVVDGTGSQITWVTGPESKNEVQMEFATANAALEKDKTRVNAFLRWLEKEKIVLWENLFDDGEFNKIQGIFWNAFIKINQKKETKKSNPERVKGWFSESDKIIQSKNWSTWLDNTWWKYVISSLYNRLGREWPWNDEKWKVEKMSANRRKWYVGKIYTKERFTQIHNRLYNSVREGNIVLWRVKGLPCDWYVTVMIGHFEGDDVDVEVNELGDKWLRSGEVILLKITWKEEKGWLYNLSGKMLTSKEKYKKWKQWTRKRWENYKWTSSKRKKVSFKDYT